MAIAYVNSTSHTGDFVSSLTKALDAGTDDNRCVLVLAITDRGGATTISSATYGGVAMTAHTAFTSTISGYDARLFYLAGAASGSNNIVVTYSDANTKPKLVAAAYSGVDGTTPVDQLTNFSSGSLGSTPSQTISSASGNLVVMMVANDQSRTGTPGSPANERFDGLLGNTIYYAQILDEAGDTSVTIDETLSGNTEYWGTALELNAASAGATGVPATNRLLMGVG